MSSFYFLCRIILYKIGYVRWPFGPSGTSSFFLVIVFLTLIFLFSWIYTMQTDRHIQYFLFIITYYCNNVKPVGVLNLIRKPRRQSNLPTKIFCEFALTIGMFGPKFWQSDLLGLYNFLRREKKVFCRFAASQQHMGLLKRGVYLKRHISLLLEKKQFFLLLQISFYWIKSLCPKRL